MKSIADVVSASGLHVYAEIALLIFFLVFLAIAIRVFGSRRRTWDHAANLPLEDDAASSTAPTTRSNAREE
ncbi:MAG TPA: cbb3-type cytochrome c oxidase subunit 3 [Gemmatimonadaceae bacterium]